MTDMTPEVAEVPTAPAAAPASPSWPVADDSPLLKLHAKVAAILTEIGHDECWGLTLSPASPPAFSTLLVLAKLLRANESNVEAAAAQLKKALEWRKSFKPTAADATADAGSPFEGLGYVTKIQSKPVTFNVYGGVSDMAATFADLDKFLRWRVGLMEAGVRELHLEQASEPISLDPDVADPYTMVQIHDYLGVSFFRMDPAAKAASKATVQLMQENYPELLSRKFFVNVPVVMQWMFAAAKLFVSARTMAKFSVLSYGNQLAAELGSVDDVPEVYGGKGKPLQETAIKA